MVCKVESNNIRFYLIEEFVPVMAGLIRFKVVCVYVLLQILKLWKSKI